MHTQRRCYCVYQRRRRLTVPVSGGGGGNDLASTAHTDLTGIIQSGSSTETIPVDSGDRIRQQSVQDSDDGVSGAEVYGSAGSEAEELHLILEDLGISPDEYMVLIDTNGASSRMFDRVDSSQRCGRHKRCGSLNICTRGISSDVIYCNSNHSATSCKPRIRDGLSAHDQLHIKSGAQDQPRQEGSLHWGCIFIRRGIEDRWKNGEDPLTQHLWRTIGHIRTSRNSEADPNYEKQSNETNREFDLNLARRIPTLLSAAWIEHGLKVLRSERRPGCTPRGTAS